MHSSSLAISFSIERDYNHAMPQIKRVSSKIIDNRGEHEGMKDCKEAQNYYSKTLHLRTNGERDSAHECK